jgi:hypothetical protein
VQEYAASRAAHPHKGGGLGDGGVKAIATLSDLVKDSVSIKSQRKHKHPNMVAESVVA